MDKQPMRSMSEIWAAVTLKCQSNWKKMWEEYAESGMYPMNLWEDGKSPIEHAEGLMPRVLVYPAREGEARGLVMVCAGGGFRFKSYNEAKPVADYFYQAGLNAAVLDYNVDAELGILSNDNGRGYNEVDDREDHVALVACEDAKRAIRLIRYHAEEWNILPDKIAIMGFSGGGCLSGMTGTRFDYGDPTAEDPIDRVSSRPDAVVLVYTPTTSDSICIGGVNRRYDYTNQNKRVSVRSLELSLRQDCPPFFITQTAYDDPRRALHMGVELANRGIPFEVHLFEEGPHGGGLYDGKHPDSPLYEHTSKWAEVAASWLEMRKF